MKKLLILLATLAGWLCSGIALAQAPDTLFVSTSQVVHLRFASDLKYLSLGDRVLVARIVDGAKDFVALRAREAFDFCTTISCLETSGAMHTFLVAYSEHPGRLDIDTRAAQTGTASAAQYGTAHAIQMGTVSLSALSGASPIPGARAGDHHPKDSSFFLSPLSLADGGTPSATFTLEGLVRRPQELYHLGKRDYGISLLCENIFVKDDILFLVLSLENQSAVSYEIAVPRFAIESRKRTKRGLQYEKALVPRAAWGLGTVAPGSDGRMVFSFDKLALIRGQVLRIYFYEKGGVRNMVLTLSGKDLMKAKAL